MKGHTIRNAMVQTDTNGTTRFIFDLVSLNNPVEISIEEEGRITFKFKDTPYIIKQ